MFTVIKEGQSVRDFIFNDLAYADQSEFIERFLRNNHGQGIDPTGMGKSLIANSVCAIIASEKDTPGVFSFASPTIVLGAQLLIETMIVFACCGIKNVSYITVNSDVETGIPKKQREFLVRTLGQEITIERNTVSAEKIKDAIERNKSAGYHTVISSTYHSMKRVLQACHDGNYTIDCHINDEPQKLVTEQFQKHMEELPEECKIGEVDVDEFSSNIKRYAERVYSVTATPRHTYAADGIGMQNEKRFGPVLHEMSERECYILGRKVPPRIAKMKGLSFQIHSPKSMGAFVFKTYEEFEKKWDVAKVLYDTKGSAQIRWFIESDERVKLINSGVNVAHCDSVNGYWINDIEYKDASSWRVDLNDLDNNTPLVCLHIEMLVEGLDLPGFNSLMLMKTRNQEKLKQLIGRIQRLLGIDRDRMGYGANFTPMNLLDKQTSKTFNKSHALVSFNEYSKDLGEYLSQLVSLMIKEYGMTPEEVKEFCDPEGADKDEDESGIEGDKERSKRIKDIIDYETYKADLEILEDNYNSGKISKIEWIKQKMSKINTLTKVA